MLDTEILDKISIPRLTKYKDAFSFSEYEQAYAVYTWNKMLAGAFTPLVQSIEVSLRNSINQGIMTLPQYGWLWFTNVYRTKDLPSNFDKLHHHIVNRYSPHDLDMYKETKHHDYKTILTSTYEKKIRKGNQQTKKAYNQHIVGNLMLGSWVVLLNSDYVDNTNKTRLWPNLTTVVFPNAIGVQKNNLFNIYNDIRLFRNRISHNEPLFLAASSGTSRIDDSVDFLTEKYNDLAVALGLVSHKRQEQILKGPTTAHFRSVCSKEYLLRLIDGYTKGRLRICSRCKSTYTTSTNSPCHCNMHKKSNEAALR